MLQYLMFLCFFIIILLICEIRKSLFTLRLNKYVLYIVDGMEKDINSFDDKGKSNNKKIIDVIEETLNDK